MENIHLIYIAFLSIGAFGLLSSLIFGEFGHGDFHHDFHMEGHDGGDSDSPRLFSIRTIFAFLMAFGIGGGSMFLSNKSIGSQIIVGILSGGFAAFLTFYIMKLLYSFQGNSNIDSDSFIGKMGSISIGTTNTGISQVKIDSGGGDQLFLAREKNSQKLTENEIVKIVGNLGNTLIVEKIVKNNN